MRPISGIRKLTPRQCEVLILAARGMKNSAIGYHLGIREQTVKNHLTNIYRGVFLIPPHECKRVSAICHALISGQINWEEIENVKTT